MKILVFLGSVRQSTPPSPARLGIRVARSCINFLGSEHSVELIDPLSVASEDVFKPHFSYANGKAPKALDLLAGKIEQADAYVMVSPEYNHAMSPALSNLLNHFGSSLFSYKPSAIVTYSAGQWGGARAAVNMRTYLSELGCLPVSAMIHVPKAGEVLDETGVFFSDSKQWESYFTRTFSQLLWWAKASSEMKTQQDPLSEIGIFNTDPSQRNAT